MFFTNGTMKPADKRVFNNAPKNLENTGAVNGLIRVLPTELVYIFSNN